jgi:hypothetical protein
MRRSWLLLAVFFQACRSTGAAPITPATPASPTPSLRASIGKRPFVARAALVTDVNTTRRMMGRCSPSELEEAKARSEWFRTHPEAWTTCGSTANGPQVLASKIYIFERLVTCDDLRDTRRHVAQNEHAIEIDLTGVWPPAPRTTLRSNAEDVDPHRDHVDASFDDYRPSDGNSGYAAFGSVTFVEATPSEGLLALDLADGSGEATARGTVHVKVCP